MTTRVPRRARAICVLLALLAAVGVAAEERRQVAISIDDLPRGGDTGPQDLPSVLAMTQKLLRPFREQRIPVIGFANAGRLQVDSAGLRAILDLWIEAGAELGNHSHSHLDINNVPLDEYTADIVRGEAPIRAALAAHGRTLEFYRHPYLHTGPTPQIKLALQDFLEQRRYRVAPVTVDNVDYAFAAAYLSPELEARVRREYVPYMESVIAFFERRAVEVVGHEIPQVLLIHANQLNADLGVQLIDMLRRRGYEFITLQRALEHPAYRSADEYVGPRGVSWIHRWSTTKGMAAKAEPSPPEWVMQAFAARTRAR